MAGINRETKRCQKEQELLSASMASVIPRTLEWAAREAALRYVPLIVIAVHQPSVGYRGSAASYPQENARTVQIWAAVRGQTEKVITGLGRNVPPQFSVNAVCGFPAEELLAAGEGPELLVVGSRGAGGFARLVMGSVSAQVTQHALCPMVVIPAGDH
jgi:nucleotide-binding universal stress UspA family protein